jgi:hypothetical protein
MYTGSEGYIFAYIGNRSKEVPGVEEGGGGRVFLRLKL